MASEHVLSVNAGGARYDVVIRRGLIDQIGPLLAERFPGAKAAVITDENVAALYLERVRRSLRNAGIEPLAITIPAGEKHKSLETLQTVFDALLSAGIERSTPLIALGGGMTTDLGGFAAATLLRGLPFVPIPTSLLAMVDAAIGGKTGVNHAAGKNLIGAFHQPAAVLIDPEVLSTLPPAELRNGLAEVIKHYLIRDAAGFERLEGRIGDCLAGDAAVLTGIIAENVAIKAAIVEQDPFERNIRAHLNFGHTFGHAFEHASSYELSHGEAVALGMCAAMHAAAELAMVDATTRDRVIALIAAAELPTRASAVDVDEAIAAMRVDKKASSGRLRFVLAERIGAVAIREDVPAEVVRSAVRSVCR